MLPPERATPPPTTNVGAAGGARGRTRSWFARQFSQPMDDAAQRRYRQRVFQMGLLVTLLLLFVDQKNGGGAANYGGGGGDTGSSNPNGGGSIGEAGGNAVGNISQAGGEDYANGGAGGGILGGVLISPAHAQRLEEFVKLQVGDGDFYAANTTGYYRGGWTKMVDAASSAVPPAAKDLRSTIGKAGTGNGSSKTNSSSSSSPVVTAAAAATTDRVVTLHNSDGRFDMQLYMNAIPGVTDLSLVYGYFKLLDGPYSSERDIYSVAKGVYLHRNGRLLLRTMTQTDANNIAFTFTLPASSAKNLNMTTTTDAAAPAAPTAGAPAAADGIGDALIDGGAKKEEEDGAGAAAEATTNGGENLLLVQQPQPQAQVEAEPEKSHSTIWDDDDTGRNRKRNRRRKTREQARSKRRESAPGEKEGNKERKDGSLHALGRRIEAVWTDHAAHPDEERRLQAVLEEVMGTENSSSSGGDKATAGGGGGGGGVAEEDEVVKVLGLTVLDEAGTAAGGTEEVAPDGSIIESVIIPNRSKSQYIRQTTTNGRGCVFTLDAHTLPRLNSSQVMGQVGEEGEGTSSSSSSMAESSEERLKWVEGLEGTLTSPECNIAMNISSEAIRLDWGKAYRKAVNYSIVVTLVCVLQIALLFRQLYYSRTQAAASRVSLLSIGQQAILDALLCIAHLLLCAMLQPLFAAFASIAFFKLVIFSIFEIRYMFIIHQSRNSQNATAASFNGLRRQLATLHARFYAILFFLLFLIYFLANYLEVIVFLLYSFWVPQIVMNAMKGVRQPLNRTYLIGMSLARLVIPLYVYGCPQNFVHLIFEEYKPDYQMCLALVIWVGLQVVVLLSQDLLGPQYMVPARFLPAKYNYYRPLPQGLRRHAQGQGQGQGEGQGEGQERVGNGVAVGPGGHHRLEDNSNGSGAEEIEMMDLESAEEEVPECVICYNNIDVAQLGSYMVSPCDHLFHRECLERWMDIKLECPVCRASLPHR